MKKSDIRAGAGLGDSIYLYSIVRHFQKLGHDLTVRSNHPAVFSQLRVKVIPHDRRAPGAIVAHYVSRKHLKETDQWQDMVIAAGIKQRLEMKLDWQIQKPDILYRAAIKSGKTEGLKRPIIALLLPRNPMDRTDGFGGDMLPNWKIIDDLVATAHATIVQIGAGEAIFNYRKIDLDLANKTSISDLLDIASMVDGFIGLCSFMLPLAESLEKPFFSLWAARGMRSKTMFIRQLTPEKVIHRKDLSYSAIDEWPVEKIRSRFNDFLREVTRRAGTGRQDDSSGGLRTGST